VKPQLLPVLSELEVRLQLELVLFGGDSQSQKQLTTIARDVGGK
jgi:hypothetical protein